MPTTRSPLRYPGGKTALAGFMSELLEHNGLLGAEYVEPFAGGAGVAIELLLKDKVSRIILNDFDRSIWSFWKCVLDKTDELCYRIDSARLSIAEWTRQRRIQSHCNPKLIDLGFSTLYMNRTNYSGIIRGGVIGGKKQTGCYKIGSRFNKSKLITKIKNIAERKSEVKLHSLDCLEFLGDHARYFGQDTFIYMDPPYYGVGGLVYDSDFDHDKHKRLAKVVRKIRQPWIMTYDCGPEINRIYASRRKVPIRLRYSANVKCVGKEILMWNPKLKLPRKTSL